MKNVYILTNHETVKNYIESLNQQTGYIKFTTDKATAKKMTDQTAMAIKKLLESHKIHAVIEQV